MTALDEFGYKALIAHHKVHHEKEDSELALKRLFSNSKKINEVKAAVKKYDSESNHLYAWRDLMVSLHAILGMAYDTGDK